MADPLEALRLPLTPVEPDHGFAADLRARLARALAAEEEPAMSNATRTIPAEQVAWPPTLTSYIGVADARRAIEWYVEVFDAHQRGEAYVMPDGSIGHAEIGVGDGVLMLAEYGSDALPSGGRAHSLHLQVPDVDATIALALARGAELERAAADEPYGRTGVIHDPFGHRWMVQTPPAAATRARPGDVGYVTIAVPDDEAARTFYGAVLGWEATPGSVPRGWQVEGPNASVGLWGGAERPEVQLCYRVADVDAALDTVRSHGGTAETPEDRPYGRLAECVDDQGLRFQLWQPPAG